VKIEIKMMEAIHSEVELGIIHRFGRSSKAIDVLRHVEKLVSYVE